MTYYRNDSSEKQYNAREMRELMRGYLQDIGILVSNLLYNSVYTLGTIKMSILDREIIRLASERLNYVLITS